MFINESVVWPGVSFSQCPLSVENYFRFSSIFGFLFFFLPNCKVSLLHHVCGNGDIRMNAILHFSLLPVTLIMCRPFVYLLDENLADLET